MSKRKWIPPDLKEGSFTAQAKKAGMSVQAYAQKKKHAKGKLGKRARLAITFKKMAKHKMKRPQ